MGHQDPVSQQLLERRQDGLEAGGVGEHLLGDPGEPLDPAPERPVAAHQRGPPVVEFAPADKHRPDLGHLAGIAAETVRLGVDHEELGGGDRLLEQRHRRVIRVAPDGKQAGLQRFPSHQSR